MDDLWCGRLVHGPNTAQEFEGEYDQVLLWADDIEAGRHAPPARDRLSVFQENFHHVSEQLEQWGTDYHYLVMVRLPVGG